MRLSTALKLHVLQKEWDVLRHAQDIRDTLMALDDHNVSLGPEKSFLGYKSRMLLGQMVDQYGLYTSNEKRQVLLSIAFLTTARDLEIYLGLATYLRQYCLFFAIASKPLQDIKTALFKPWIVNTPRSMSELS